MTARLARILCVALAMFMPATALAQLDTGTIVGRVTDPSGAVLPGVLVTLTQDATGVAATTVTNASGEYVFPGQRIGRYTVAAELEGFKKAVLRGRAAQRAGAPAARLRARRRRAQ